MNAVKESLVNYWIKDGTPALVLAPMEGVTDAPMRALLTETGAFSLCVSEFIRVSHEALPPKVFRAHVPELASASRTASGTPVQVQVLGGDPELMAESARRAAMMGANGIDINFGCPAPTVNRHDGGATLLKYPSRIRDIVGAVRRAVPAALPVSAKFRLGWDRLDPIHENADRAIEGGASWITIHGRTKMQGYAPPAYWDPIGEVKKRVGVPVVANGDIWSREDFLRCRDITGSEHFMIGRGALADPTLPATIARELGVAVEPRALEWLPLLQRFVSLTPARPHFSGYVTRRIKQWLRMAANRERIDWFDAIKRLETVEEIFAYLGAAHGPQIN